MFIPLSIPSARYTDKADIRQGPLRHRRRGAGRAKKDAAFLTVRRPTSLSGLTRIKFDNHRFVDVASDISAIRSLLEGAHELGRVDFNPLWQTLAACQIKGFLDAQ